MLSETQVLDKLSSRGQDDAGENSGGQKPRTGPIPAGSLFSSAEYQKTGNGLARLFYI